MLNLSIATLNVEGVADVVRGYKVFAKVKGFDTVVLTETKLKGLRARQHFDNIFSTDFQVLHSIEGTNGIVMLFFQKS